MTQARLINTLETTGYGTFIRHRSTMYASVHTFNDAAYNVLISKSDWVELDAKGTAKVAELFGNLPGRNGEHFTIPQ